MILLAPGTLYFLRNTDRRRTSLEDTIQEDRNMIQRSIGEIYPTCSAPFSMSSAEGGWRISQPLLPQTPSYYLFSKNLFSSYLKHCCNT